jgi:hypothetical protein
MQKWKSVFGNGRVGGGLFEFFPVLQTVFFDFGVKGSQANA